MLTQERHIIFRTTTGSITIPLFSFKKIYREKKRDKVSVIDRCSMKTLDGMSKWSNGNVLSLVFSLEINYKRKYATFLQANISR